MTERQVPGRWLVRLAPWLVDDGDFERAVGPALADLHFEWGALRAEGRDREASGLARATLARIVFFLLPVLVVRRRAQRLLAARWAPLVPALAVAALGTWAFRDAAPSPAYVTLQLAFVGAGLALALLAGTTSAAGWRRFGPVWGLVALGALALALGGEGLGGARRWAMLGPLRVQTSLLFWPLFVVGLAALGERGLHGRAIALLAAALILLAAQRDPATALPWALAACATLWVTGAPWQARLASLGVAAAGVGLSFDFAVTLAPLPHVEGVWGLLVRQNPPGALAALACAAAIVAAPFAAARRSPDRFARGVACGLGALSAGLFLRPLVVAEPVPLLGYGGSGAIGVLLGLGLVAGLRGEARDFLKVALAGPSNLGVIHVAVEVTPQCHSCPPSRRAIKHRAASEQLSCTLAGALRHDLGEMQCHAHPDTPTHVRAMVIGEHMMVQVDDACCEAFVRRLEACLSGELALRPSPDRLGTAASGTFGNGAYSGRPAAKKRSCRRTEAGWRQP